MDNALVLLLRLRLFGAIRKAGRKLGTARGLVLTLVGLSFVVMMVLPSFFTRMPPNVADVQIAAFRRFGPFFFILYCLLILLLSPGDKAFAFSPAEVSFLFPGPFGRRALLAYKIGGNLALTCFGGIFFLFAFRQFWTHALAGYVGLVLAFSFLQLFQIGVTVAGQAIGAKAATRRRQLGLAVLVALVTMAVLSVGINSLQSMDLETLKNLENKPWVIALKAPFQPFIRTVSASRLWPDVPLWGAISLAIDAAVFLAILGLDAQYLEAAAAGSERFYAKLERMRKGGPTIISKRKNQVWKELPAMPWLGGIGPIFWRQITTAVRDYARAAVPFGVSTLLGGLGLFLAINEGARDGTGQGVLLGFGIGILAISIALSPILTFDFRGDFERMEGLKTLPLRPSRVVIGQIAAPWLLMTLGQYFGFAVMTLGSRSFPPLFWAFLAFAPLLNFLLFESDNLIFLLFPSRPVVHTPGDVQVMGRMMLVMFAKAFILIVAIGLANFLGFAAYFVVGTIGAFIVAWISLALASLAMLPLLSMAFRRFDVASETPS